MDDSRDAPGNVRWGWRCPRCDEDAAVSRDPASGTFRWECADETCRSVGFGFTSRRRARIALREYRERYRRPFR